MKRFAGLAATVALVAAMPTAAATPLSALGSFRLGSSAGIQCSAQSRPTDAVATGMFDRAYALSCRDATAAPGKLYVLTRAAGDPVTRLQASHAGIMTCDAARAVDLAGVAGTTATSCRLVAAAIPYTVYTVARGDRLFVAEGLSGYDDALRLALRSLIADRVVVGTIGATVTAAGDAAAFARVQAGNLDPALALGEAYRRNNGGSYAEASEFFAVLSANEVAKAQRGEFLLGAALQQSNLGAFAEADALFARVPPEELADPVGMRLSRNFHAIHLLNERRPEDALAELDRPVVASAPAAVAGPPVIDASAAARLNRNATIATPGAGLTAEERAQVLDAQALELRGAALRLGGDPVKARAALVAALAAFDDIGRREIASVARLRSAALADLAGLAETSGDLNEAETRLRAAVAAVAAEYPDSLATLSVEARLAALLARRGKVEPALALYRTVVVRAAASGTVGPGLLNGLAPYFALLARESVARPALTADFFAVSQLLLRPGVAQTQAVLARELSGGDDEAARLFRQATALTRDVDRARIEIARIGSLTAPTADDATRLAALRTRLPQLELDQTATTAALGKYPRFRAIATTGLTLADLQAALKPGEAYFKLTAPGTRLYGMLITPTTVRLYAVEPSLATLARKVSRLRASIVVIEDGAPSTKPYDVALAYELFQDIAAPIAADLRQVHHLIYEPDGPLLKLPLAPLVMERAGVDAYAARQRLAGADPFDFRGVAWVGRSIEISTSVSPLAFRDLRNAAASRAAKAYIGFGQNAPLAGVALTQATTRGIVGTGPGCTWSPAEWSHPVPGTELHQAATLLGGTGTEVVTGPDFTDTNITARTDLAQYRILHFATHGLVTAPHPDCPARPALMTSFGAGDSDGLLTFAEVFNLHLDADLVILSACDTAGAASVGASREAGLATGGDFALDGLVRAFVGAGGRVVIASHWPVPDEFNATQRLIAGLFSSSPGASIAGALHSAQLPLMDAAATSHPYYWAAFSVVGDGARSMARSVEHASNAVPAGGR